MYVTSPMNVSNRSGSRTRWRRCEYGIFCPIAMRSGPRTVLHAMPNKPLASLNGASTSCTGKGLSSPLPQWTWCWWSCGGWFAGLDAALYGSYRPEGCGRALSCSGGALAGKLPPGGYWSYARCCRSCGGMLGGSSVGYAARSGITAAMDVRRSRSGETQCASAGPEAVRRRNDEGAPCSEQGRL